MDYVVTFVFLCRPIIIKEILHYVLLVLQPANHNACIRPCGCWSNNNIICFEIAGFGIPTELLAEAKNPHCLYLTWKKAICPVNGYRVYCFPADSWKPELMNAIVHHV